MIREIGSAETLALFVRFWLTKGSFATTVLAEIFETGAAEEEAG